MSKSKILIAVVAIAAIVIGIVYYRSTQTGSRDTANLGEPIVDVILPQLSGTAAEGAALFAENCVACHGDNASGRMGAGPPLVHLIYEPNHHGDASFHLAVARGVRAHHWPFGNMPPVEGLSEAEVAKIVTYIRTLQRANGIN